MNKRAKKVMAEIIRQRREALGLTQRALAQQLRMPQGTISAWETEKAFPDGLNLIYLELAMRLEEGELLRLWKQAMIVRGWLPRSLGPISGGSENQPARSAGIVAIEMPLIGRWVRTLKSLLAGPVLAYA